MHEPLIKYCRQFDLASDDYVMPASSYLIDKVAEVFGWANEKWKVQPILKFTVPRVTLDIVIPPNKLARLEGKIKEIEKHFKEQGWLKSAPK